MTALSNDSNTATASLSSTFTPIKTRSKTGKSFEPISLSTVKTTVTAKTTSQPNQTENIVPGKIDFDIEKKETKENTQTCPCHQNTEDNKSWICCSHCKQWWHSSCALIPTKDIQKYTNYNIYYLCIFCKIIKIKANNKEISSKIINLISTTSDNHINKQHLLSNKNEKETSEKTETNKSQPAETIPIKQKEKTTLPELFLLESNKNYQSATETPTPSDFHNRTTKSSSIQQQTLNEKNNHILIFGNITSNLQTSRDIRNIYKVKSIQIQK